MNPGPRPVTECCVGELPMASWTEETGLVHPEKLHIPDLTANKRGTRAPLQYPQALTMVVSKDPLTDAERLLRKFMNRAYRSGVPEPEFERCFAFAKAAIERKACFQDALRVAYKAVLGSPDFLFITESPGRLSPKELASRLSYFLWRSAPDSSLHVTQIDRPGRSFRYRRCHAGRSTGEAVCGGFLRAMA